MGMIVRVHAGIAGIAQLHLQGNVNGGTRPANSEKQQMTNWNNNLIAYLSAVRSDFATQN